MKSNSETSLAQNEYWHLCIPGNDLPLQVFEDIKKWIICCFWKDKKIISFDNVYQVKLFRWAHTYS